MGFLTWLAETAVGAFIKQLFGALKDAWNGWLATENARQAGRAEAQRDAANEAASRVQEGDLAEVEARKDHANADISKNPNAGLDTEFRRRDP